MGRKAKSDGSGAAPTPAPSATKDQPFDRYTVEVLHRSKLVDAPYNPRIISDDERKHLKNGLKRHGMLAPPVWNRRTGHIVGGHQRIAALDSMNGSPDYTLKVAVVDLDEAQEKEANLVLNNPNAQGDWDLAKLESILHDKALDLTGTGFDMGDIFRLFGDAPGAPMSSEDTMLVAEQLRAARAAFDKVRTKHDFDLDYYLVVVFRDEAQRGIFLQATKLPDNRYQDGRQLMELLLAAKTSRETGEGVAAGKTDEPATTSNGSETEVADQAHPGAASGPGDRP